MAELIYTWPIKLDPHNIRAYSQSMSSRDLELLEIGETKEESQNVKPLGCKERIIKILKENIFMILILAGVVIGFGLGFGLRAATDSPIVEQWISKSDIAITSTFHSIIVKLCFKSLTT